MQGDPKPWESFVRSVLVRKSPSSSVRAFLTAHTGYFEEQPLRPSPSGLPTLREFQRAQGLQAVRWHRRVVGAHV